MSEAHHVAGCQGCGRELAPDDSRFALVEGSRGEGREKRLCIRCALEHRTTVFRSARLAAVVGTLMVLVNQGAVLFGPDPVPDGVAWRIAFTYCVPFLVATYGALGSARRQDSGG